MKQFINILEFGVSVWNSGIKKECNHLFVYISLGNGGHNNYKEDLDKASRVNLEVRKQQICLKFAVKASNHPKHKEWFLPLKLVSRQGVSTRLKSIKPLGPYLNNLLLLYSLT